ncbi:ATP-NAD kinase family protein, partial [Merdimonas faecis]
SREVIPALYCFLKVLDDGAHLQRAKEMSLGDGEEAETLAEDILSEMREDTLYIIGPGGTTYRIKEKLHSKGTVRGVDLVKGGQILYRDADEQTIWRLLGQAEEAEIIVTCIGGNGFLFGRGNQQISPRIIRAVRKEHIRIAVTRQKLAHLGGKPMLVDTGDRETDEYLKGYYKIRFNGRESALYRVDRN